MRGLSSSSHACSTYAADRGRHDPAREGTDRPGARRAARVVHRGHARRCGQQRPRAAGHGVRRRRRAGVGGHQPHSDAPTVPSFPRKGQSAHAVAGRRRRRRQRGPGRHSRAREGRRREGRR
ncbi:hypothetical protein EUA94_21775 [Nocardioides zhouii]|uniref:Uncharacterized protein n=1 Tax=Nocardioides zhouii TaxID=1168729 RepID=A0A4Q2SHZ3_9ACTN|nr:hypothetical protein EUA94_21775 [Nocardioides zhouii]